MPNKVLFLTLLLILLYISSFSQNEKNNIIVSSKGDSSILQPVLLSEISTKVEETNNYVNKINDKLKPDLVLIEIDSTILNKTEFFQAEQKRTNEMIGQLSLRKIEDIVKEWKAYSTELKTYRSTITKKSQELEDDIDYLALTVKTWEITNKTINEQNGPIETQKRIREEITKLTNIETKVKERQDQIYKLQNNITDLILLSDEMISILEKEKLNWQSEYFRQDSPALWNTSDTVTQRYQFEESFSFTVEENIQTIKDFVKNNSAKLYLQLFIFIFLVLIFYLFHRKLVSSDIPDDGLRMKKVRFIFRHYFSSPLLFSIVLSIWLYPDRPSTVTEFLALILVIPSLILYIKMLPSHLRHFMYIIIGIFIIEEFQLFFGVNMLFSRILLLIKSILSLWILYSLMNTKSIIRQALKGNWWNFVYKIAPIFVFFIIVSIIANILGYVNLSVLLSNTIVTAILFAIALSLVSIIISSLLIVLFQTKVLLNLNLVNNHQNLIEKRISLIVSLIALYIWIKALLSGLGVFNQISNWFSGLMESGWKFGTITISFGGIISFFIVVVFTAVIVKIIKLVLEEELFPRIALPRGVPGAISMIIRYFIVGWGIYIALEAAGLNLSSFSLLAGALGVGIGFGLQNIVANFISGLILAFERPIQAGDTIEVGTLMGDVKNIGVRASTIRTFDGSDVIVPNSNLITHEVVNWTLSDRKRRREIPVSVAYGNNPREVLDLINEITVNHEAVLKNPKPWATFEGFGESSLNFKIRFWVGFDIGLTVKSEVAMGIYDALIEAGISIPFPQHDLHIKSFDPAIQKTIFPGAKKEKDKK